MCLSTCTGHFTPRAPNIQRKTPAPDWGEHRFGQGGSRAGPRDFARFIADGIAPYQFTRTAMKQFYPPAVLRKQVAQAGKTAYAFRARTGGRFSPFPRLWRGEAKFIAPGRALAPPPKLQAPRKSLPFPMKPYPTRLGKIKTGSHGRATIGSRAEELSPNRQKSSATRPCAGV
jgi:alkanesulfonate monooxygenase SsuD/methylene tetrahydromethanopterin reductase-like flavin-dependent oxidoreductase (luciferase family)